MNFSADSGFAGANSLPAGSWRWLMLDASGSERAVDSVGAPTFASQGDAETWIGEMWRDLLDAGVDAVTLLDGDRKIYGPMSLHPDQS